MGRRLRMYDPDRIYFVSVRAIQARLLLRPSAEVNEVIGGVLARAVQQHGVELYAYVFASNHLHLLVRARDGVLSKFMQYLLGNLARKVGRLVDWSGKFWERRFSAEPVLDQAALDGRLKYILAHGVKEGLVERVEEWPGLSCLGQLLGDLRRQFTWFHWKSRWSAGKLKEGGEQLLGEQWAERIELELAVLPHWAGFDQAQRQAATQQIVASIEEEARSIHKSVLGRAAVEAAHPHFRPQHPKRTPQPMCHTVIQEARLAFLATYRSFVTAYREASERFRNGDFLAVFPPWAFPPPGFNLRILEMRSAA